MKKIIFFTVILLSFIASSENTQIFKCHVSNKEWTYVFVLDAIGEGFLKLKKRSIDRAFTCALILDYINNGQRNVSPNITLEFKKGICAPDLGDFDKEILNRLTLVVDISHKEKPEGYVQWLKSKQPDHCVVEKISMFDISRNSKKWIEGNWGRKTAKE